MNNRSAYFLRITAIFNAAKESSASHLKGVERLKRLSLSQNFNFDEYMQCIKVCIHAVLIIDYKIQHPEVERIVAFIGAFAFAMHTHQIEEDPDVDSPIMKALLDFLIKMSMMDSDNHRFRSTQFICRIFKEMIGNDITEECYQMVQECLLALMDDRIAKIRMLAANAITPLQDLEVLHCPVISAYLSHMEFDSSAGVRRICAEKIALKREIIPSIMETSRDVDINVKLTIYSRAKKYPNKFKIFHRQILITQAMNGEDALKKFVANAIIPAWLQHREFNYLSFMSSLRLDSSWEDLETTASVCEFMINSCFETRPSNELLSVLKFNDKKLLDFDMLNYDSVLYWRIFLNYLRKQDGALIDEYAPQLPDIAEYIKQYCIHASSQLNITKEAYDTAYLEFNYTIMQLFLIITEFNYVDVSCRNTVLRLIENILATYNFDVQVINVIVKNIHVVEPDVIKQSQFVCDIAGELMYHSPKTVTTNETTMLPIVDKSAASLINANNTIATEAEEQVTRELRLKFLMLESDLDFALRQQDYLKASELKPELDEAKKKYEERLAMANNLIQIQDEVAPSEDEEEEEEDSCARRAKKFDPEMMKRVLTMIEGFLTTAKLKNLNSTLATFKVNVIDDMIHSPSWQVKFLALKCLALCSTLDEHTAHIALPTYCAIIMMHNKNTHNPPPEPLVLTCIAMVINSLLRFGTRLLAKSTSALDAAPASTDSVIMGDPEDQEVFTGGVSLSGIMKEFFEMFNDENVKIQEATVRGVCFLILSGRINSHVTLSRLIVKYVSATTPEPEMTKIQQLIGVTLGQLPSISSTGNSLEQAIIPALRIVLKAPPNSVLSDVDVDHVSKLLFRMLSLYEDGVERNANVALALANEIRERPNNEISVKYAKILLLAQLGKSTTDPSNTKLQNLQTQLDDLRDRVCDQKILGNIIKLCSKITIILSTEEPTNEVVVEEQEVVEETQEEVSD